jgi:hypothetical protein
MKCQLDGRRPERSVVFGRFKRNGEACTLASVRSKEMDGLVHNPH